MADTTKLKRLVEPHVRKWLGREFRRGGFREKGLTLVTGKEVSFDAVSGDGSVVAAILSNRALTRTGHVNSGGLHKAETDFWRRANITDRHVRHRLMVFTDRATSLTASDGASATQVPCTCNLCSTSFRMTFGKKSRVC